MRLRWLMGLLLIMAVCRWLVPWKVGVVWGHSMTPILRDKQLILIDQHYYRSHPIRRGDIVSFAWERASYVKMVYGVSGDTIIELYISEGKRSLILGPAEELPMRRAIRRHLYSGGQILHLRVPQGFVYVIGSDPSSRDSRDFGLVPIENITGVVMMPLSPDTVLSRVASLAQL